MSTTGAFKDVIKRGREPERTLPVGEFIAQLDQFIAEHNPYRQSKVIPAIGGGQASLEVVKRYAKELYYLGLWMTPEFPLLIANAPSRSRTPSTTPTGRRTSPTSAATSATRTTSS